MITKYCLTSKPQLVTLDVVATGGTYELIVIGADPGGIALAAEAQASGIDPARTLVLEKGATHNAAIRQFYPRAKADNSKLQRLCGTM